MPIVRQHAAYESPVRPRIPVKLLVAGLIALVSLISYCSHSQVNPVTGKTQHISMSEQDEIAIGLQSAPEMISQFGGEHPDPRAQNLVDRVGARLVETLPPEIPKYPYEFHLLADTKTVNAFALPGGQVFITMALLSRLETEGQLAGVLGHEVGHVLGRHSAERMAKARLTQGLVGAAGVATSGDGHSAGGQQIAAMVGNMVLMKYGRDDELESDRLGLRFMYQAGYDPRALIRVMEILEEASGGSNRPEFSSTHPNPGNRIAHIEQELSELFPDGIPTGLTP